MSLILDALRRADAERERGAVPTLRAQADPLNLGAAEPTIGMQPWVWIVAGGAVGVLVPFISYLLLTESPKDQERTTAAPPPALSPAVPSPVPTPTPAVESVAASAAAPTTATASPAVTPTAKKPTRKPPPPKAASATHPAGAASSAESPLPSIADLPEEVRRGLPPLAVSGTMYSEKPENRMVIINGQLLRENEAIAPELALEQIRRKSVVLRYRGQRFEVSN